MAQKASADQNEAYRAGRCISCLTEPHSSGRPRCAECHFDYIDRMSRGEI